MIRITSYLTVGVIFGISAFFFAGTAVRGGEFQEEKPADETHSTRQEVYEKLKQERYRLIKWLGEYARKGQFPEGKDGSLPVSKEDPHFDRNHERVHRILGPNEILCALAHLIAKSGHKDLVKELAKKNNHFCVGRDKNTAIEEWILSSGLTLEECIEIQVPNIQIDDELISGKVGLTLLLEVVVLRLEKNSEKSLQIATNRFMKANS